MVLLIFPLPTETIISLQNLFMQYSEIFSAAKKNHLIFLIILIVDTLDN